MRKFIAVFAAILLIALIGGCGNVQQESKKTSKIPVSTEVPQVSSPVATSSNLNQSDNEEEEFKIKGKLKTKKARIGVYKYFYSVLDDGTVWLNKISFMEPQNINVLKIPSKIKGREVTVLGSAQGSGVYEDFGDGSDCYETNILGVYEDESFGTKYPKKIYENTKKIKKIILPSTIKIIGRDAFMYLPEYKILDIDGCVAKNINVIIEDYLWSKIKVSKSNSEYKTDENMILSKDGEKLVKAFGMCDKLSIPNGVKSINGNAFTSIKTKKLFIPSSVTKFDKDRIVHNYIKSVSVSKDNETFGKLKNSLYKKKNKELVILCNSKEQEIVIPEGIKIAKDFCYNMISADEYGKSIKKIVFPKSMKEFAHPFEFSETATFVFKSKKCPKIYYSFLSDSESGSSKFKIYVPRGCKKEYKKKLREHIGAKDKIIVWI